MQERHLVISGFIITALLAAVILNGWVPFWVVALVILAAGVGFTYMRALGQRQQDYLANQQALVRALQDLHKADSYPDLVKNLELALHRVLAGKATAVKVLEANSPAPSEDIAGWEDLFKLAETNSELQVITREDEDWCALPVKCSSPESSQIFLCWKQKHDPAGLPVQDKKNVSTIAAIAAQILTRLNKQHNQEQFLNQLLLTAVKAREDQVPGFSGHGERVALIADILGQQLGLDERERRDLHYAALLHDIGRVSLSQGGDEDHPDRGAAAFPAGDEWDSFREAVRYHHERYDGSGFPEGRKMTDIPLLARILAVADIFDGLTALAPEENRLPSRLACQAIQKATGSGFDPLVVVALQESLDLIEKQLAVLTPPKAGD
ncbi:MAG: HD domain-containing protein [Syntrophomonadaceae bacterium]|nr:HD domain-containing protein [Syntrophomonadaceae bacterium]